MRFDGRSVWSSETVHCLELDESVALHFNSESQTSAHLNSKWLSSEYGQRDYWFLQGFFLVRLVIAHKTDGICLAALTASLNDLILRLRAVVISGHTSTRGLRWCSFIVESYTHIHVFITPVCSPLFRWLISLSCLLYKYKVPQCIQGNSIYWCCLREEREYLNSVDLRRYSEEQEHLDSIYCRR